MALDGKQAKCVARESGCLCADSWSSSSYPPPVPVVSPDAELPARSQPLPPPLVAQRGSLAALHSLPGVSCLCGEPLGAGTRP